MKNIKGFTLVELLLYTAIASVATIMLVSILISNSGLLFSENARVEHGLALNGIVSEITANIKISSSIPSGYPQPTPTINTSSQNLVLQVLSFDSSHNIIQNTFDYIVYRPDPANPKRLLKEVYPDSLSSRPAGTKQLTNNLTQITFSYTDALDNPVSPAAASKVKFTIQVTSKSQTASQSDSASGQANLRND